MISIIIGISLHVLVINDYISLDDGLVGGAVVHSLDGGSVQVDSVVDDEEGVVVVHDVVVHADSVEVLLEERLEEHVLLF